MRLARFDEVRPSKEQRSGFDCGEPSLNRWLVAQARQRMESRDAVTYLLMAQGSVEEVIAGYYCLASGSVSREEAPEIMQKAAPEPIPAIRMGRLGIDHRFQGQGWGAELLREALMSAVSGASLVGARVILVDAISEEARACYLKFGFAESPIHPMQVLYDLRTVAASAGLTTPEG